ncbi:unnamed protein product, partial [Ectocarpus fasciculatus]
EFGSTYFGTQYGSECFCGDENTNLELYCDDNNCEDVVCDTPCTGDESQICGGAWAMSVYLADPIIPEYIELGCAADPKPSADGTR